MNSAPVLWLVLTGKMVAELILLLLVARGAVALLSWGRHRSNPVWQLLQRLTSPVERLARQVSPAVVLDKHLPLLAGILCVWCWLLLVVAKGALQ